MNPDVSKLLAMLSYRRPAGSESEKQFIKRFIAPLGTTEDKFGNHMITIGKDKPTVLWSCHTDSVHRQDGFQKLSWNGKHIALPKGSKSNCLGADDAAGVWILMQMIEAKVPGLYIFHRSEEIGCIGSSSIAMETPEVLDGIRIAVAFDRRGTDSVITHQGQRCCSDAFANSLAKQLPKRFRLDATGVLTDTRIYMPLVDECSNVSVGYWDEHSPTETLDVEHLLELRDHMVAIDQTSLVIERSCSDYVPYVKKPYQPYKQSSMFDDDIEPKNIQDLVWMYPRRVADFLEDNGITFDVLLEEINNRDRRVAV